jgi:hypothetical protein
MNERKNEDSTEWNVIHTYTRVQAIEDGVLIDVTEMAREAGIVYPTAITAAVWADYVRVPEGIVGQDEAGRLWDVLWMFRTAASTLKHDGPDLRFQLYVRNDNRSPELVTLKGVCGPGDELEPVVTIMLPGED